MKPLASAAPAAPSAVASPGHVEFLPHTCRNVAASVQISRFGAAETAAEYHFVVTPTAYGDFATQVAWVELAYLEALHEIGIPADTAVLRRYFCSDLVNQRAVLDSRPLSNPNGQGHLCAVSRLNQPPMPPAKVSLWAYHLSDPHTPTVKSRASGTLTIERGGLLHHWTVGVNGAGAEGADAQTRAVLNRYDATLREHSLDWRTEVVRTWLFVHDILANYSGVVAARREFFQTRGLTADTHYIASTGIEGTGSDPAALLTLDAYAIGGVQPGQIMFLSAPEHLGPTHRYGVTFERGVAISYQDRRHILISGTASIDPQGNIVHPNDVSRQVDRTLDNIDALLASAGAGPANLVALTVYVRDPADHSPVAQRVRQRCGAVPMAVVVAAVCRPGWLVEIEGMAIVPRCEPGLPAF